MTITSTNFGNRQGVLRSLLFVIPVIVTLLAIGFNTYQSQTSKTAYTEAIRLLEKKKNLLIDIERSLGYGGFIHNFKNYVLRQDPDYLIAAENNILRGMALLQDYKLLVDAAAERIALDNIESTFVKYRTKVDFVKALETKLSPREVDALVKVSDALAVEGFMAIEGIGLALSSLDVLNEQQSMSATVLIAIMGLVFLGVALFVNRQLKKGSDFEAILKACPDSIIATSKEGVILRVNHQAETLLETPVQQLEGMPIDQFVLSGLSEKEVEKVWHGGDPGDHRDFVKTSKGDLLPASVQRAVSFSEVLEQDLYIHYVRDDRRIWELMQQLHAAKKDAESLSATKSDFIKKISHELNTPMNGILGGLQALSGQPLSFEAIETLNDIFGAAEALHDMIADLLGVADFEKQKIEIHPQRIAGQDILKAIERHAAVKREKHLFTLTIEASEAFDKSKIELDLRRFNLVIVALLNNAVQHCREGEIIVKADILAGNTLQIIIEDRGDGIPYHRLKAIYETFEQGEEDAVRRTQAGLGLGLSVAHKFIHLMRGNITLNSRENVGTSVMVRVPIKVLEETTQNNERLLVVDDNHLNRKILIHILENEGFTEIEEADGGQAAIDCMRFKQYKYVFLDHHMPEVSGIDVLEQMRNGGLKKPEKLYIYSADMSPESMSLYQYYQVDGYVAKPIAYEKVRELVAVSA